MQITSSRRACQRLRQKRDDLRPRTPGRTLQIKLTTSSTTPSPREATLKGALTQKTPSFHLSKQGQSP